MREVKESAALVGNGAPECKPLVDGVGLWGGGKGERVEGGGGGDRITIHIQGKQEYNDSQAQTKKPHDKKKTTRLYSP